LSFILSKVILQCSQVNPDETALDSVVEDVLHN
jgi:hypothetical protein